MNRNPFFTRSHYKCNPCNKHHKTYIPLSYLLPLVPILYLSTPKLRLYILLSLALYYLLRRHIDGGQTTTCPARTRARWLRYFFGSTFDVFPPKRKPVHPRSDFPVFRYMDLPYIPWVTVLEQYLNICCPNVNVDPSCRCRREYGRFPDRLESGYANAVDSCCHLYYAFDGYHARYLPLMLTNRAVYGEFRRRKYKGGWFVTRQGGGNERFGDHKRQDGEANVWISPKRAARGDMHPVMRVKEVSVGIWHEIRYLRIELSIRRDVEVIQAASKHLQLLVRMLKSRPQTHLLRRLEVEITYPEPAQWNETHSPLDGEDEAEDSVPVGTFEEVWEAVAGPLGEIVWGREGAREVTFTGLGKRESLILLAGGWEGLDVSHRRYECRSWEEFEGLGKGGKSM